MKAVACLVVLLCAFAAPAAGVRPGHATPPVPSARHPITDNFTDYQLFQLALNLEYLEAEFYLFSAYGYGLDVIEPALAAGGPPPVGGKLAALSPEIRGVAAMLALQEVGHVRIIREFLGNKSFPRPALNIGKVWETLGKNAHLPTNYPFDPYSGDVPWLLAAFNIPYVGLTGYVGSFDYMSTKAGKHLLGGVEGVEGGQDAMLRTLLWSIKDETIPPFGLPVETISGLFVDLANNLTHEDVMENIVVPPSLGSENKTSVNILASNASSLSFQRTPAQVLATIYGTGHAEVPGGFFPNGAHGDIAKSYL